MKMWDKKHFGVARGGLSILALTLLVAGCSTMQEIRTGARTQEQQTGTQAQDYLANRPALHTQAAVGPIVTDAPYVDARPVDRGLRLPTAFQREITINDPMGISMPMLAQRIQTMTGVAVSYTMELQSPKTASQSAIAGLPDPALMRLPSSTVTMGQSTQAQDATIAGGLPPLPALPASTVSTAAPTSMASMPMSYTGSIEGLLNEIAQRTDATWEYDDARRRINFYRYKLETFTIPATPGSGSTSASMGGTNQSGGGGMSSLSMASASGTHKTEGDLHVMIGEGVKQLLSTEGAYSMNPLAGTLVVRDRPERLEMVRRYMSQIQSTLSRQVDVQVTIYRVIVNDDDTRAFNWNVLFQTLLAGKYNIALTSGARPSGLLGNTLSSAVLSIPERNANGGVNRFGGSTVMLDALSQLGRTSVLQNTSVMTSNNQAAPLKMVHRTSYLAQVAQNLTTQGGNQQSTGPTLTPGSVETGLNMYVLPSVMDDGKRLLLKMMVGLSTLDRMDSAGNSLAQIQLPQVSSREFQQQAWLNSGETLVLAGFEQTDTGSDTKSPFNKGAWFLGGSSRAHKGREVLVITVRPVVFAARSGI